MSVDFRRGLSEAVPGMTLSERAPDRLSYARDLWPRHHIAVRRGNLPADRPQAIAWPESTEQVAELLRFCAREGVSVVPFGAGSGVCGGVLPTNDTLVLDLKRLQRWRRFSPSEGYIEVEAGALGIRLEEDLQARGFTIGHFPSSILCSTVGGWVAARGAGQCSGLYGKIEDMVAGLECVDGRGETAWLQRRIHGPDLTPLIIGSEGVLCAITAARLRLHRVAEQRTFGAFEFRNMEDGWEAIREIYQRGLRPAVCRLYDPFDSLMAKRSAARGAKKKGRRSKGPGLGARALRELLSHPGAINRALDALAGKVLGGAMLVVVFEGVRARTEGELAETRSIAAKRGARDLGEGPARHWYEHRYSVSYRQAPLFMLGAFVDTMEVAAPWSQLGALYNGVRAALGSRVFLMAHMSHAYPDGCCIYFTFAASDDSDDEAERRYDETWRAALSAVIDAGGTLSHHHGVGRSKAPRMGDELGLGVEIVAALESAFDPNGIMNPKNLLPPEPPPRRPLPAAPSAPELDASSQLVHAAGSTRLADVERCVAAHGLSLGIEPHIDLERATVAEWLAQGAPGSADPWLDPVDHLVAGYSAELPNGGALVVRPCPRRAVGPDLFALFFGTGTRAGRIHSAHLRARARNAEALETPIERDPLLADDERRWLDRALAAPSQF